jgi:polyhydroxyalkanoate synthesis regulator phasin
MASPFEDDGPSLDERRRALKAARIADEKAGGIEKRVWASLHGWMGMQREALQKIVNGISKEARESVEHAVVSMGEEIAKQQAKAFDELRAELLRHVNDEMTHELRDMRKATQDHASMRAKQARDAARQACEPMRAEIAELRREIEKLRAKQ